MTFAVIEHPYLHPDEQGVSDFDDDEYDAEVVQSRIFTVKFRGMVRAYRSPAFYEPQNVHQIMRNCLSGRNRGFRIRNDDESFSRYMRPLRLLTRDQREAQFNADLLNPQVYVNRHLIEEVRRGGLQVDDSSAKIGYDGAAFYVTVESANLHPSDYNIPNVPEMEGVQQILQFGNTRHIGPIQRTYDEAMEILDCLNRTASEMNGLMEAYTYNENFKTVPEDIMRDVVAPLFLGQKRMRGGKAGKSRKSPRRKRKSRKSPKRKHRKSRRSRK